MAALVSLMAAVLDDLEHLTANASTGVVAVRSPKQLRHMSKFVKQPALYPSGSLTHSNLPPSVLTKLLCADPAVAVIIATMAANHDTPFAAFSRVHRERHDSRRRGDVDDNDKPLLF
jgi:hypothetical protein